MCSACSGGITLSKDDERRLTVKSRETLMKETKIYNIQAFWDTEAAVWVATSEEVSGLATEADTLENLNDKLREIIPQLLILNGMLE